MFCYATQFSWFIINIDRIPVERAPRSVLYEALLFLTWSPGHPTETAAASAVSEPENNLMDRDTVGQVSRGSRPGSGVYFPADMEWQERIE